MPIITLTTDFGLSDPFVGAMKGGILGIAPNATLIDLCHDVPPQNILVGALMLEAACPYFPTGTIHVAVVDPGVGSERAPIAIETEQGRFVGPDNGLFTAILERDPMRRAVRLTNPVYHRHPVSATFHGRDLFAPVAAHLAAGAPFEDLGEPIRELVSLPLPRPVPRDGGLELHILHVDRFGNLVTDLRPDDLARFAGNRPVLLRVGETEIAGIRRTYADVERGEPVAYFGSAGRLEIAVREGSAAEWLGLRPGEAVWLMPDARTTDRA